MTTTDRSGVIIRRSGEGERRWFFGGGEHIWKATAAETGGAFILFEDVLEQGKVTPWHSHPDSAESLYVLEGEIVLRVGEEDHTVGAGGFVYLPVGVAHAFRVTSPMARLLALVAPGTAEAFYRRASEVAGEQPGVVDFGRIRAAAVETGVIDVLGPPPFRRD